eukprot:2992513-Pyramimonas_sp.AAC.1
MAALLASVTALLASSSQPSNSETTVLASRASICGPTSESSSSAGTPVAESPANMSSTKRKYNK